MKYINAHGDISLSTVIANGIHAHTHNKAVCKNLNIHTYTHITARTDSKHYFMMK